MGELLCDYKQRAEEFIEKGPFDAVEMGICLGDD